MTPRTPETSSHTEYTTPEALAQAIGCDAAHIRSEWQRLKIERVRSTQAELDTMRSDSSAASLTEYLERKHGEAKAAVATESGEKRDDLKAEVGMGTVGAALGTAVLSGDASAAKEAVQEAVKEGKKSWLKEWIDEARSESKEGGIGGFFSGIKIAIGTFLAKLFRIDLGTEKTKSSEEKQSEVSTPAGKPAESQDAGGDRYALSVTALTRLFIRIPDGENSVNYRASVSAIAKDPKFYQKTYAEISHLQSTDSTGDLSWDQQHSKSLIDGVKRAFATEIFTKGFERYKQKNPSDGRKIENIPMIELINMSSSDLSFAWQLSEIDVGNMSASLSSSAFVQADLDAKWDIVVSGPFAEQMENLGLSKQLIYRLTVLDRERQLATGSTPTESVEATIKAVENSLNGKQLPESDRETLRKVLLFSQGIQQEIITNTSLNLGCGNNFAHILTAQSMNFSEMAYLYSICEGKTAFADMGSVNQTMLMGYLGGMASNRDEVKWKGDETDAGWIDSIINWVEWLFGNSEGSGSYLAGRYDMKLAEAMGAILLNKSSQIELPTGVRDRLIDLRDGAMKEVLQSGSSFMQRISGMTHEKPLIAVGILGLGLIYRRLPIHVQRWQHWTRRGGK